MALVRADGNAAVSRQAVVWNNIERSIDSILSCVLCSQPYKAPKTLQCGHSFCRVCLGDYILQQRIACHATSYFVCPVCAASFPVPPKLAALPGRAVLQNMVHTMAAAVSKQHCATCGLARRRAAAAHYCTLCEALLCDECAGVHKQAYPTRNHLLIGLADPHTPSAAQSVGRPEPGEHADHLYSPTSICTNKAGDVLVSNANDDVAVFSPEGVCKKHLSQQPFYGDTTRHPHRPNRGLAFTQEGFLAVALRRQTRGAGGACVAVVQSLAGREVGTCVTKVVDLIQCLPSGIAVMSNGHLVVSDAGLHCVYMFDNKYKFVRKFGKKGAANDRFSSPYYVTTNSFDEILVSDYGNHCVKIFDHTGKFTRKIGVMGTGKAQLLHPMGICTDLDMNVVVADRDNHRVHIFDVAGNYRAIAVKDTFQKGRDVRPVDVTLSSSGRLLVLLTGVEGEDFSEIQSYEYALCGRRAGRSGRAGRRNGSAPPASSLGLVSLRSTSPEQKFSRLEGCQDSGTIYPKADRSLLLQASRGYKAYIKPVNFEANFENRRLAKAHSRRPAQDPNNMYDSEGYDYHPRRQLPDSKPSSKVCSIM